MTHHNNMNIVPRLIIHVNSADTHVTFTQSIKLLFALIIVLLMITEFLFIVMFMFEFSS